MTIVQEKKFTFNNQDQDLASYVRRLGNPISTNLLHETCSVFSIAEVDGIIGYQLVNNCAVVIGDPICLPQYTERLTQEFRLYCQKNNLRIIYFLVSDFFAHWAINNGYCQTLIQVGEELVMDPTQFRTKQKLRWKINQSINQGVKVKKYERFDLTLEKRMNQTIDAWLKSKQSRQIHMGNLHFFLTGSDKRIFYAEKNNKIVGLLKLVPVDLYQGWVLSAILAASDAPVGTTEHLMSVAFDALAEEDCHFLCLGAISGSHLGEIIGLNGLSKYYAHLIFWISKWFFNLDARRVYLNKYHPYLFPTYVLFNEKLSINELLAIKQILNVKL